MTEIDRMIRDRDEALMSLDEKKIRLFLAKYDIKLIALDADTFWREIHAWRLTILTIPLSARLESCQWLIDHGVKRDTLGRDLQEVAVWLKSEV